MKNVSISTAANGNTIVNLYRSARHGSWVFETPESRERVLDTLRGTDKTSMGIGERACYRLAYLEIAREEYKSQLCACGE